MGGPYKISNKVAAEIRDLVAASLMLRVKASDGVVRAIKEYAENDYFNHQDFDPEYRTEGGPANLVDKTMQEVEKLRGSTERLG